ncbi:MAG: zf-HC2 domain-containing protein, partial [Actinobacteria bacterium]|nr:zf-HC2 domain-containing protein [Actinomycetota bacterium]
MLAYCNHVAADGQAEMAAAEAFRRFRTAVVQAPDLADLEPEALLISATRHAAAAHVPEPPQPPDVLRGVARRPATGWCGDVPALLAARADRAISRIDLARLEAHLSGCPACRAPEARFKAAERAYRNPPDTPLPLPAMAAIIAALATAAPIQAERADSRTPRAVAPAVARPATPEAQSINGAGLRASTPPPPPELRAATEAPVTPAAPQPPAATTPPLLATPEPPLAPAPDPLTSVHAGVSEEIEAPRAVPDAVNGPPGAVEPHSSERTVEFRIPEFVDLAADEAPVEPARGRGGQRWKSLRSLPSVSLRSLRSVSLPAISLPSLSLPKRPARAPSAAATSETGALRSQPLAARPSSTRPFERLRPATLLPAVLVVLAIVIAMVVAGVFGGDPEPSSKSSPAPASSSGGGKAPDVIVVPGRDASAAAVEAAKARARARAKRDEQRQ